MFSNILILYLRWLSIKFNHKEKGCRLKVEGDGRYKCTSVRVSIQSHTRLQQSVIFIRQWDYWRLILEALSWSGFWITHSSDTSSRFTSTQIIRWWVCSNYIFTQHVESRRGKFGLSSMAFWFGIFSKNLQSCQDYTVINI